MTELAPEPWTELEPEGNYSRIIDDTNGVRHFWLSDGTYDGCDGPGDSLTTRRAINAVKAGAEP